MRYGAARGHKGGEGIRKALPKGPRLVTTRHREAKRHSSVQSQVAQTKPECEHVLLTRGDLGTRGPDWLSRGMMRATPTGNTASVKLARVAEEPRPRNLRRWCFGREAKVVAGSK